jgi:hypothetical protein
MKRATDIIGTEVNAMRSPRLIVRLGGTANQLCFAAHSKFAVEQARQLMRIE